MAKQTGIHISMANLLSLVGLCFITVGGIIAFSSRLTAMETKQLEYDGVVKEIPTLKIDVAIIKNDTAWIKKHLEEN